MVNILVNDPCYQFEFKEKLIKNGVSNDLAESIAIIAHDMIDELGIDKLLVEEAILNTKFIKPTLSGKTVSGLKDTLNKNGINTIYEVDNNLISTKDASYHSSFSDGTIKRAVVLPYEVDDIFKSNVNTQQQCIKTLYELISSYNEEYTFDDEELVHTRGIKQTRYGKETSIKNGELNDSLTNYFTNKLLSLYNIELLPLVKNKNINEDVTYLLFEAMNDYLLDAQINSKDVSLYYRAKELINMSNGENNHKLAGELDLLLSPYKKTI